MTGWTLIPDHRSASPKRVPGCPGRPSQAAAAPGAGVPGDCHPEEAGPRECGQADRGRWRAGEAYGVALGAGGTWHRLKDFAKGGVPRAGPGLG